MTVLALLCVDKFGRRRLLMTGAALMGLSIFTLGLVCHFQNEGVQSTPCLDRTNCHQDISNLSTILPHTIQNIHSNPTAANIRERNESQVKSTMASRLNTIPHTTPAASPLANDSQKGSNSNETAGSPERNPPSEIPKFQRYLGFFALMAYVAAFAFSFGPGIFFISLPNNLDF